MIKTTVESQSQNGPFKALIMVNKIQPPFLGVNDTPVLDQLSVFFSSVDIAIVITLSTFSH